MGLSLTAGFTLSRWTSSDYDGVIDTNTEQLNELIRSSILYNVNVNTTGMYVICADTQLTTPGVSRSMFLYKRVDRDWVLINQASGINPIFEASLNSADTYFLAVSGAETKRIGAAPTSTPACPAPTYALNGQYLTLFPANGCTVYYRTSTYTGGVYYSPLYVSAGTQIKAKCMQSGYQDSSLVTINI